jgi:D-alanyl-D-alanine carboxypeptidase
MRRIGIMMLAIVLCTSSAQALTTAQAMKNPRHAALVIDADTGRVLRNENASARRYPASLTKMMTLYMTFRALQAGQVSMDQMLPVSKKAAAQPQTNISLKPGSKISVRDCILALIVRSANDSAMVLAEALGGNQENFAAMMTNTAHQLGMKSTMFRNPNGLPDNGQFTTAYDMARLGIALRRDFPQYYPMFKVQSFSYNGRYYGGHNRVLARLNGVDGIKTGYIRLSGFNLVSSMKKDGVNLVAVVMGGNSGAERDDYMVSILKDGFTRQLAAIQTGTKAENISLADASVNKAAARKSSARVDDIVAAVEEPRTAKKIARASKKANQEFALNERSKSKKTNAKLASGDSKSKKWGVQVGAFRDKSMARAALNKATKVVRKGGANPQVAIASDKNRSKTMHRAVLSNLSHQEAMLACQKLQASGNQCLAIQVN